MNFVLISFISQRFGEKIRHFCVRDLVNLLLLKTVSVDGPEFPADGSSKVFQKFYFATSSLEC